MDSQHRRAQWHICRRAIRTTKRYIGAFRRGAANEVLRRVLTDVDNKLRAEARWMTKNASSTRRRGRGGGANVGATKRRPNHALTTSRLPSTRHRSRACPLPHRIVDFREHRANIVGKTPFRIMRLKAAHIANPPDVIANAVVVDIGPVHRTAG